MPSATFGATAQLLDLKPSHQGLLRAILNGIKQSQQAGSGSVFSVRQGKDEPGYGCRERH